MVKEYENTELDNWQFYTDRHIERADERKPTDYEFIGQIIVTTDSGVKKAATGVLCHAFGYIAHEIILTSAYSICREDTDYGNGEIIDKFHGNPDENHCFT